MSDLQRGADGEPLPAGEWVKRAFKRRMLLRSGEISELQFKRRRTTWKIRGIG